VETMLVYKQGFSVVTCSFPFSVTGLLDVTSY